MWKLIVGFVIFAGVALFVINKAGDKADLGGEKAGVETHAAPASEAKK